MNTFNRKNHFVDVLAGMMFALALTVTPAILAQDGDSSKQLGFEEGRHEGHLKDKGERKGLENERNPLQGFYGENSGVDFELTVHNHAVSPTVTFTATYNSVMTIQEVLTDILGESADGFYFQECYETLDLLQGTISDCEDGESPTPLDSSSTLDAAGIVDDPEVHLVYLPG